MRHIAIPVLFLILATVSGCTTMGGTSPGAPSQTTNGGSSGGMGGGGY